MTTHICPKDNYFKDGIGLHIQSAHINSPEPEHLHEFIELVYILDGNACTFTVTATEGLQAMNRIIFEAELIGHPEPALFAIPVLGK